MCTEITFELLFGALTILGSGRLPIPLHCQPPSKKRQLAVARVMFQAKKKYISHLFQVFCDRITVVD